MFKSEETFVFIEKISGISKKSGNPYLMFKVANKNTFENMTISGVPALQDKEFSKGDLVKLTISIGDRFGNVGIDLVGIENAGKQ